MEALNLLKSLGEQGIEYFLLRPVTTSSAEKDIDVIMSRDGLKKFVDNYKNKEQLSWRKTNAKETLQIKVDDLIIDAKFEVSFLPYKILNLNIEIPFSGIKQQNGIVVPSVEEEILFTFWTLHLVLDKIDPRTSSTYSVYLERYANNFQKLSSTKYFKNFLGNIEKKTGNIDIGDIYSILFSKHSNHLPRRIIRSNNHLLLKYYQRKLISGIKRRAGVYKFRSIRSVAY